MKKDRIMFGPEMAPGTRVAVRRGDEGDQTVVVRRIEDGAYMPSGSEIVSIEKECRCGWHDTTTLYRNGPAQVATPAYRDGYDRIFGTKSVVGCA